MARVHVTIPTVETVISITYSQYAFVAVVIRHAMRMRRAVICGLCGCTVFFAHYIINGTILGGKYKVIEHNIVSITFIGRPMHSIV